MHLPSPLPRKRARIEIIPLIDIIFFLLATFVMLSLSMVKFRGVPVTLPEAHASVAEAPGVDDVVLTITEDGLFLWNKELVPDDAELGKRFADLRAVALDARVIIHGDAEARLGRALAVLDLARTNGLNRVQFQTRVPVDRSSGNGPQE